MKATLIICGFLWLACLTDSHISIEQKNQNLESQIEIVKVKLETLQIQIKTLEEQEKLARIRISRIVSGIESATKENL